MSALGTPAYNTFPIRLYEPGTRRVENPDAAPAANVSPRTLSSL
jgi:hypothetical protein